MPFDLLQYQLLLPSFGLVLARVSGLVLGAPMFSSQQFPARAKVLLIAAISLMAFPAVRPTLPEDVTFAMAIPGMVGEFVIGHLLGFAAATVFFAAQIGGKLISHQSGMALGTVFNPVFNEESTVLDQIWFFTAMAIFLAVRGHVAVVMVLLNSFEHVPPMLATFDGSMGDLAIAIMRDMFELGMRLSGPAVMTLFLTSLLMGFLTKTMPQLNILSVGFSLKIAAALFAAAITIGFTADVFTEAAADSLDQIGLYFQNAVTATMGASHAG